MNPAIDFVKIIANRLDSAKIPYMLTGSMAMSVYSIARSTRDIDLVVEMNEADIDHVVALFETDCYIDADSVRDAVARQSMFNIIHNDLIVKADFIVRKGEPYRRVEFDRRKEVSFHETRISIVAPEDLVLSKLIWAKQSESELQLRDVRLVLEEFEAIDRTYLREWATKLGLAELLEAAERND